VIDLTVAAEVRTIAVSVAADFAREQTVVFMISPAELRYGSAGHEQGFRF
jgi:hypothetical protein